VLGEVLHRQAIDETRRQNGNMLIELRRAFHRHVDDHSEALRSAHREAGWTPTVVRSTQPIINNHIARLTTIKQRDAQD